MNSPMASMARVISSALLLGAVGLLLTPVAATAQAQFVIKPVAEKKLKELPASLQ